MQNRSVDQQDLKNEHIQIFVRIVFATIASCTRGIFTPYQLKKHADIAMYQAKLKGKDNYCFYEEFH